MAAPAGVLASASDPVGLDAAAGLVREGDPDGEEAAVEEEDPEAPVEGEADDAGEADVGEPDAGEAGCGAD
jgi:hypothetical protein